MYIYIKYTCVCKSNNYVLEVFKGLLITISAISMHIGFF